MFDNLWKETVRIYFGLSLAIMIAFLLALALKASSVFPVGDHDMPNGVICYTYLLSLDCIQVKR